MDGFKNTLAQLNKHLSEEGMAVVDIIDPNALVAQKVNARYMSQQTLERLVSNVKRDRRLESLPLVYKDGGEYKIISGHHRVLAAQKAGLANIMVLVTNPESEDEVRAKQLSHNALVGLDDEFTLKKIFDSIKDLELKLYSGVDGDLPSFDYSALSVSIGFFLSLPSYLCPRR